MGFRKQKTEYVDKVPMHIKIKTRKNKRKKGNMDLL